MTLNHSDVLIVDATVIVGLLILLTFESFSPFFQEDLNLFVQRWDDLEIEQNKNERLVAECDAIKDKTDSVSSTTKDWCENIALHQKEVTYESEALREYGVRNGYVTSGKGDTHTTTLDIMFTPLYINTINLIMIVPFASSAIVESVIALKKKTTDSSKIGTIIMIIGFAILLIGFFFIVSKFYSTVEPYISYTDSDFDGLSDLEEKRFGTDMSNPDTDGDGLSDAVEIRQYNTDPLKSDTDGDGLYDKEDKYPRVLTK